MIANQYIRGSDVGIFWYLKKKIRKQKREQSKQGCIFYDSRNVKCRSLKIQMKGNYSKTQCQHIITEMQKIEMKVDVVSILMYVYINLLSKTLSNI